LHLELLEFPQLIVLSLTIVKVSVKCFYAVERETATSTLPAGTVEIVSVLGDILFIV
jgi:hypothetical protein